MLTDRNEHEVYEMAFVDMRDIHKAFGTGGSRVEVLRGIDI